MRAWPVELAATTTRVAGRFAARSASVTGAALATGILGVADGVSRARVALSGPQPDAAEVARRSARAITEP